MPRRRADEHTRRGFGRIRLERSGRWSVAYIGPDGRLHRPTTTYLAKDDAIGWLNGERDLIRREEWTPPAERRVVKLERGQTFREYSTTWLATRRNRRGEPLKPRTVDLYNGLLRQHILPTFGDLPLVAITPDLIDTWHRQLLPDKPTRRAHAYALLFSVLKSASSGRHRLIRENPCQIEGAAHVERKFEPNPATPDQIRIIVAEMPEKYRAFVLVAAFCGLRYGELAELRRKDLDLKAMTVRVARGVVWRKNQTVIGTPKSRAGIRTVAIPSNLKAPLEHHLEEFAQPGPDGLMFSNAAGTGHLHPSTIMKTYRKARKKAGREDLRIHDLRHTHATLAAQAGATLKEMMERMGQSTVEAAMVYQHVAAGRDAVIAERMAKLAEPTPPTRPADTSKRSTRRRRMTDAELAAFTDRSRPITDYIAEQVSYGGYLDILLTEAGPAVALDAAIDMAALHGIALTTEIRDQATSLLHELDAYDVHVQEHHLLEKLAELSVEP